MSGREHRWRIGDREVVCRIEQTNEHGTFYLPDSEIPFRLAGPGVLDVAGKRHRFYVIHSPNTSTVWVDGHTYHLQRATNVADAAPVAHSGSGEVRSLMPGKLLRLTVEPGDTVTEKQTVAVMESMKMESPLTAPRSGRVAEIRFKPGDVLDMGETVMIISAT
jgi:biotin carboxyl carrier protein